MTLAWALILIACVWFAIISPGFRKVFVGALGIGFIGFLIIIAYVSSQHPTVSNPTSTPIQPVATTPPPPRFASADDLVVSDLRVVPAYNEVGSYRFRTSGYQLTARVKNGSTLPTRALRGELVALDCQNTDSCEITGRERISTQISILPSETARLQAHVWLNAIAPAKHKRKWRIDFDEATSY